MKPVLLIAPYPKMAESALRLAKTKGIPLCVEVGINEEAKLIAANYPDCDVIISRGGTANDLKSIPNVTVVEIKLSITDLIQTANPHFIQGFRRIGVVTIENTFDEKVVDLALAETTFLIRPCKDDEGISNCVRSLWREGVEAIVGCRIATATARELGLPVEFLESSDVSIGRAMDEALKIVNAKENDRLRLAQLNAIINNIEEGVVAVSGDSHINFFNSLASKVLANGNGPIQYNDIRDLMQYRRDERIVSFKEAKLLVRSTPLVIEDAYKGDVLIFQEVSSIQKSERSIRMSLYQKGLYAKYKFPDIIGKSEVMQQIVARAKKYSQNDSNILIYGETGTGKEILTQSIHNHSQRSKGPFVSVNCAAIPSSIMESELFGYVEGAFTGARKGGKIGLFELAHGGTIFLDEIGEVSLDIQNRLLRVLQEKEIMRVGDDKIVPVDIRVICATNKQLLKLVNEGRFREDLYYRINVLNFKMPALRERREDIALLINHFLRERAKEMKVSVKISQEAMKMLMNYDWPGNIRQLANIIEVISLLDEPLVSSQHIAEIIPREEVSVPENNNDSHDGNSIQIRLSHSLKEMEAQVVHELSTKFSQNELCAKFGISRATLWRRKKYFNYKT